MIDDLRILLWGSCGSACLMFFGRAYSYLVLNGFNYYGDIRSINIAIRNHNNVVKDRHKKFLMVREMMTNGDIILPQVGEQSEDSDAGPDAVNQRRKSKKDIEQKNALNEEYSD